MDREPDYYESNDLAIFLASMRPLPSKCTSADAVRVRVKLRYMHPDAWTARKGALWTPQGVQRELAAERSLQREAILLGIKDGNTSILLQRRHRSEPKQLSIEAVA